MRQAAVVIAFLVGSSVTAATPPWQRTEARAPCTSFDPLRAPYFGDLHIHTHFSADAYIFGTRVGPPDAYAFARGAPIALADDDEAQTRSTRLDRPLDFAAVTDHSEFFGEVLLCDTPGSFVYNDPLCQLLRHSDSPDQQNAPITLWQAPDGEPAPMHHPFCNEPGVDLGAASSGATRPTRPGRADGRRSSRSPRSTRSRATRSAASTGWPAAARGRRTSSARSSSWTTRRRDPRGTRCRSTSTRAGTWSG